MKPFFINRNDFYSRFFVRHFDTAFHYGNEEHVGKAINDAIKAGIVKRSGKGSESGVTAVATSVVKVPLF